MKKLLKIIIVCLSINSAMAEKLEDVSILDIKHVDDAFELKLHAKNGPKDSFFFLAIVKKDEQAFSKLAIVFKKLKNKNDFKLSINIPSFSMSPNGSYYRSNDITFFGTTSGESLLIP